MKGLIDNKNKSVAIKATEKVLHKKILFTLLLNIQLTIIPLYTSLPALVIIFILGFSLLQFYIFYKNTAPLGKWLQLLFVVFVFTSLMFIYGNLFGRQAGVSLIILMTVLKVFEIKAVRDVYVIIYSCFFIIASTFFQSQTIWLILYVLLVVIVLCMTLILLSDRRQSLSIKIALPLALRYVSLSIPLMFILFIFFPRIPGPLWALPDDAYAAQMGLSEEMSPGSIHRLISSSAIAFRVKFNGDIPKHSQRYWRGAVLSDYDGKTWRREDAPKRTKINILYPKNKQQQYSYTVTLEPTYLNWLLSLEYAKTHESGYVFNREAMLLSKNKINKVISYHIESDTAATNQALYQQENYKNRLLPVDINPETLALAKTLIKKSNYDKRQYVKNVRQYFKKGGFIYTLSPGRLGLNAIDDFLFRSKRGFCEHYASAFTYLMRAAGIPARIVVGYQGGEMNPLDDYMIVRQSDAHAWTEVWIENHWLRIDPTAVIAPQRIEQGVQNSGLDSSQLPLLLTSGSNAIKNIVFLYDSFQNSWNQWVIGFDQKKQNELLTMMGFKEASLSNLILLLVSSLTVTGLLIAWLLFRPAQTESDRVQHFYLVFCRKMQRYGVNRQMNEGPVDFEQRLLSSPVFSIKDKGKIRFIIKSYQRLRYGEVHSDTLKNMYIKKVKVFRVSR